MRVEIRAEMAGIFQGWKVSPGQAVEAHQEIGTLESMKMEIPILAPGSGVVEELRAQPGDFVQEGDVLAVLQA
jgi:biotin carboxyl carrier protein